MMKVEELIEMLAMASGASVNTMPTETEPTSRIARATKKAHRVANLALAR